ncbi:DUF3159 domain-containing protein [Leucobacter insecticola]|uniref:DUF3159 domain-containing protein n=2 Tax=Leucobacter insecticola TaxID=2714934 RepID=A0A6G8FM92_9MICO|nr:DUF3159 domain-containing protein [Leucobacter insecticola]
MGRAVSAGLGGEALSRRGVLEAIGGWRGILETLVPGMLFLVVFAFTRDEKASVIAPAALAVIAVAVRLFRRESAMSAFSGAIGVAIAVAATLITGKGSGYYIPGFWTNGAWSAGLLLSIIVGWPLLGFALGAFRQDLTGWRGDRQLRRIAFGLTFLWLGLFVARLAVQLPLFFASEAAPPGDNSAIDALGIARLVMGLPLFALVIIFTWMVLNRASQSSDDSDPEAAEDAGEDSSPA